MTEDAIEQFAIKLFEGLDYNYIYAPNIAPDGEDPQYNTYAEVLHE